VATTSLVAVVALRM